MAAGHDPTSASSGRAGGHPGLDALADLDAGLLDDAGAAGVGRHAETCPGCAAVLRGLQAVRADLRSMPPAPLPDAVAARLDATLAELRAERSVDRPGTADGGAALAGVRGSDRHGLGSGGAAAVPDLSAARQRRRARRRRVNIWVAASAVAVTALVGVGGALVRAGHESGTTSSAKGTVMSGGSGSEPRAAGTGPHPPAANPPGAAGGVRSAVPNLSPDQAAGLGTVTSYTKATLSAAVGRIARQASLPAAEAAGTTGPAGALADTARRDRCSAAVAPGTAPLVAVQAAVFEGTPAFVLVYRGDPLKAVVVGSDCGLSDAPRVLYRTVG